MTKPTITDKQILMQKVCGGTWESAFLTNFPGEACVTGPLTAVCAAYVGGGHVYLYYLSGGQLGNIFQSSKCTSVCQQFCISNDATFV